MLSLYVIPLIVCQMFVSKLNESIGDNNEKIS